MWLDLCQQLCCPIDHGELRLEASNSSARIDDGLLVCSFSGEHRYQIHAGIADFRSESYDHLAGVEPAEYGTVVTPAVAKRVTGVASGWTLDAGCARRVSTLRRRTICRPRPHPSLSHRCADPATRIPTSLRATSGGCRSRAEHSTTNRFQSGNRTPSCRRRWHGSSGVRTNNAAGALLIDTPNESRVVNWAETLGLW
jgi:uncharacterized protein YbaR (Trm112 family)